MYTFGVAERKDIHEVFEEEGGVLELLLAEEYYLLGLWQDHLTVLFVNQRFEEADRNRAVYQQKDLARVSRVVVFPVDKVNLQVALADCLSQGELGYLAYRAVALAKHSLVGRGLKIIAIADWQKLC